MSAIVRPHVAISQRVDVVPDRSEQRDALDQNLVELAWQIGLMPCLVPNALGAISGATDAWLAALKPRGFILSGGNDLGDFPERDSTETVLLEYAKTQRLPLLGICRGMQMLAVWAGAALRPVEGHVRTRHQLRVVDPAGGWPAQVNSFHNLALCDCPPGFSVTAYAENGDIEAIRHHELPWEAWMWHPEREPQFAAEDIQRIRTLFHA